jgi:uncharacterized membrane protein
MWLGIVIAFAVLLAVIGGVVVGGIFALILVPIAAIILVFALVMSMWARATSGRPSPEDEHSRSAPPYPHGGHQNASPAPATPDQLVDARQKSQ